MSDATIQIRDPIHTFISLNSEQAKIVDSPLFQRLRHIKQLALASLVYPGALHTRFEHSLGVFHVACEMLRRLGLEGDDINVRAVRFAALLHDLGHGPFSHVSEQSLNMFADRDSLPAEQKNEKIHELITAKLIRENPVIIRAIEEDTAYKNYSQWQDARFLTEFSGKKAREGKCKQILDRLMARRLFKRVFSVDLDQFPTEIKAELSRYTETPENLEMRIRIERGVADVLSSELSTGRVDPDLVIFKCVRSKPICDLALNDGVVLVDDKVRLTPIEECSRFLRAVSKNGAGGGVDVEVYAPVEWGNHTKRDAICDRLSARIMEAIKTGAKGGVSHDSI